MAEKGLPEVWLRGPVAGVPPLLQGVAQGLLHSAEEIHEAIGGMTSEQLRVRPSNVASVAFHVRHVIGSMDRLFTYALGETLTSEQREVMAREKGADDPAVSAASLLGLLDAAIERAVTGLRGIDEKVLTAPRAVGRAQLPSTVLGLLDHVAQHTARHTGQIVTTSKIARAA